MNKKTQHIALMVFGAMLALSSLWLGAYWLGKLHLQHWARIPAFLTSLAFTASGMILVMFSAACLSED